MPAAAVLPEASGSAIGRGTPDFLHIPESGRLAGDDMAKRQPNAIAGGYEGLRLVTGFIRLLRPGMPILGLQACGIPGF